MEAFENTPGPSRQCYSQGLIALAYLRCWALAAAVVSALSGGCSSDSKVEAYPTVVEVVYKNDTPVNGAVVTFRSMTDKSITAKGRAGADGICRLTTYERDDGAILGEHQAIVVGGVGGGNTDLDDTRLPTVAPPFSSFSTANLQFTVTENEADNHFKITVTP